MKPTLLRRGGWIATLTEADVAGSVRLPDTIRAAVAALNALEAEHVALAEHERRTYPAGWQAGARAAAAQRLVTSLLAAPEVPADAGADLVAADATYAAFTARLLLVREATEQAGRTLDALASESTITAILAHAFAEVLATVRELPADTPTTAEAALGAPAGRIAAYRTLSAALDRHAALRACQAAMASRYHVERDTLGLFRDTPLGPDFRGRIIPRELPPAGPREPVARLLWLAGEGQGWMPSPADQDAAFTTWATAAARSFSRVETIAPLVG